MTAIYFILSHGAVVSRCSVLSWSKHTLNPHTSQLLSPSPPLHSPAETLRGLLIYTWPNVKARHTAVQFYYVDSSIKLLLRQKGVSKIDLFYMAALEFHNSSQDVAPSKLQKQRWPSHLTLSYSCMLIPQNKHITCAYKTKVHGMIDGLVLSVMSGQKTTPTTFSYHSSVLILKIWWTDLYQYLQIQVHHRQILALLHTLA